MSAYHMIVISRSCSLFYSQEFPDESKWKKFRVILVSHNWFLIDVQLSISWAASEFHDGIESSRSSFSITKRSIAVILSRINGFVDGISKLGQKFTFDKLRLKYNCKPIKRRSGSCSNRTMMLTHFE